MFDIDKFFHMSRTDATFENGVLTLAAHILRLEPHLKMEYEIEAHEMLHICITMLKGRLHVIMFCPHRFVCVA